MHDERLAQQAAHRALNSGTLADVDEAQSELNDALKAADELLLYKQCPNFGPTSEARWKEIREASRLFATVLGVRTSPAAVEFRDENGQFQTVRNISVPIGSIRMGDTVEFRRLHNDGISSLEIIGVKPKAAAVEPVDEPELIEA
jgi:hypothetical protein